MPLLNLPMLAQSGGKPLQLRDRTQTFKVVSVHCGPNVSALMEEVAWCSLALCETKALDQDTGDLELPVSSRIPRPIQGPQQQANLVDIAAPQLWATPHRFCELPR